MDRPIDTGYAPGRWAFDSEVTRVFDDMLRRSIPDYDQMRSLVFRVGRTFVKPATSIVDLGCSRGGALRSFATVFAGACRYVGVEISPPMLEAARAEFNAEIQTGVAEILDFDLRRGYPKLEVLPSLTLAVLTLQFIPIEHRPRVIRRVAESLPPGGAFIVVEKVLSEGADIGDVLVNLYHEHKVSHGYSKEEVDRKALALEGVLVPLTESANVMMLRNEGFRIVQPFWRHLNFAGWVALK